MSFGRSGNRAAETSSRVVQCYYCAEDSPYKDLKSHCLNAHGKPLRVKGQLTLADSFNLKKKPKPTPDPAPTQTEPSQSSPPTDAREHEKGITVSL